MLSVICYVFIIVENFNYAHVAFSMWRQCFYCFKFILFYSDIIVACHHDLFYVLFCLYEFVFRSVIEKIVIKKAYMST